MGECGRVGCGGRRVGVVVERKAVRSSKAGWRNTGNCRGYDVIVEVLPRASQDVKDILPEFLSCLVDELGYTFGERVGTRLVHVECTRFAEGRATIRRAGGVGSLA